MQAKADRNALLKEESNNMQSDWTKLSAGISNKNVRGKSGWEKS